MSLGVAHAAWAFGAPLLLGVLVLRILGAGWRADPLGWLGRAWIFGAGTLALGIFAVVHLPVPREGWWATPIPLILALGIRAWRAPGTPAAATSRPPLLYTAWVLALALAVGIGAAARQADPVIGGDEASIWAAKAKVLWTSDGITDTFDTFMTTGTWVRHADYPLLNPLLQAWVFANAGSLTHFDNRLPIQLFALALVLVVGSALARAVRPLVAAPLLLILFAGPTAQRLSQEALGDLMCAGGLLLALDGFLRWRDGDGRPWAAVAAGGLAIAVGSKNEGLLMLGAAGVALLVAGLFPPAGTRRRVPAATAWLLVPIGVAAATWAFNAHHGFSNDLVDRSHSELALPTRLVAQFQDRIGPVVAYFGRHVVLDLGHSSALFLVFLVLLIGFPRRTLTGSLRVPTLLLLVIMAGDVAVYVATPHDLDWHLATSAQRVSWQGVPALTLVLALYAGQLLGLQTPKRSLERGTG